MLAGIELDFARHDEDVDACRRTPGFFTIVARAENQTVGYSVWLQRGHVLHAWPARYWGACTHAVHAATALALAEGRRRGAAGLLAHTVLSPEVVRRWLGYRVRHCGDLLVRT